MPNLPSEEGRFETRCRSCTSPLADDIARRLRAGQSPEAVSAWLRGLGEAYYVSAKGLRDHRQHHLMTPEARAAEVAARDLRRSTPVGKAGDLAALVRDLTVERVEAGDLAPSLAEGLRAQEMIDRRSAKDADRETMIALAGLLSGATVPVAVSAVAAPALPPPPGASEAEWRELTDERAEDEAAFVALLAPADSPIRPVEAARNR